MKKKYIALIAVCLCVLLLFCACGKEEDPIPVPVDTGRLNLYQLYILAHGDDPEKYYFSTAIKSESYIREDAPRIKQITVGDQVLKLEYEETGNLSDY